MWVGVAYYSSGGGGRVKSSDKLLKCGGGGNNLLKSCEKWLNLCVLVDLQLHLGWWGLKLPVLDRKSVNCLVLDRKSGK